MKKIIALISAVVLIPVVASAQRFEYDGIELVHGNRVESSIKLVFPMYFGVTAVPGYNFATAPGWKANTDYRPMKNFHYGLEIASLRFYSKASHMETSLGLRWDFMNIYPSDLGDRMRATYFGVPLRFAYKAGRGSVQQPAGIGRSRIGIRPARILCQLRSHSPVHGRGRQCPLPLLRPYPRNLRIHLTHNTKEGWPFGHPS